MVHKFLQVDVLACRDLDSQFSAREAAAIKEWRENSTQAIHSMRDHPGHGIGMVGASWSTDLTRKLNGVRFSSRTAWQWAWKHMKKDKKLHARRNRWGPDQDLLAKWVFICKNITTYTTLMGGG